MGVETEKVAKRRFLPPHKKWETMFKYIENTPALRDIVVSGGDTFALEPAQLALIGHRLLSISHIRRILLLVKVLRSVLAVLWMSPMTGHVL